MLDIIAKNWARVIFGIFAAVFVTEIALLDLHGLAKAIAYTMLAVDILIMVFVKGEELLDQEGEENGRE